MSFMIGELAGLYLLFGDESHQSLGIFVIFYTFVQFFEMMIHKYGNNADSMYSKLLLLNLGLQGIVFFICMNRIYNISIQYFVISALIGMYVFYKINADDFKNAIITENKCLQWNFMTEDLSYVLTLMYVLIFYFMFSNKSSKYDSTVFIDKAGIYFLITAVISFVIYNKKNSPSIWCLSSAILAPILTII